MCICNTVDGTAVDGTAVDGTAGTDGLSSSDGPLLDTTQIIIVAVAASIGSLVACGVLLLIILLCVLAKRGRKGNMATKPDVESDGSKGKLSEQKNSSIPKTEEKTDLTERSSVDGAPKSNGKLPMNTAVYAKDYNKVNIEGSGSQMNQQRKATRPAPGPPRGAKGPNRPPAPRAPGKGAASQSLTTTTRKYSSNVQRPTHSLTTHS